MLWTKLEANTIMLDRICRASRGGATRPSCRANDQRRLEWPTFLFWWRGKSMLSRHSQQRDKASLSRQAWWRDRAAVPRQRPTQTRKACISVLVAWQVNGVAPLPSAQQSLFVAPPRLARQGCCATPTAGLHFSHVGTRAQACRATGNGATSMFPENCMVQLLLLAAAWFVC